MKTYYAREVESKESYCWWGGGSQRTLTIGGEGDSKETFHQHLSAHKTYFADSSAELKIAMLSSVNAMFTHLI